MRWRSSVVERKGFLCFSAVLLQPAGKHEPRASSRLGRAPISCPPNLHPSDSFLSAPHPCQGAGRKESAPQVTHANCRRARKSCPSSRRSRSPNSPSCPIRSSRNVSRSHRRQGHRPPAPAARGLSWRPPRPMEGPWIPCRAQGCVPGWTLPNPPEGLRQEGSDDRREPWATPSAPRILRGSAWRGGKARITLCFRHFMAITNLYFSHIVA